ncbi:hypothetical protein GOP47_0012668 [Adiantum capillus-veneris]|uniref:S-acyltransferase n=1 Tax=Adiantum capillus-veneris TaxID=13818 RepID=A0A9D4ZFX2_ADICA|nr:hypothetical protein GOP47_0012668 [Adiantum capillus-veneris]
MAWNVFRFCTGLRIVGSIMIVVVLAIVAVSYYAVVIASYIPQLLGPAASFHDIILALLVLLLFHALLFMLLWCYFSVVLTDPGSVPQAWSPAMDEDLEAEAVPLASAVQPGLGINLPTSLVHSLPHNSKVRFCKKCNHFKPPRCHHCSVCGRCILKMDHHCVWVVNCVGARNYKYFLLFLFYTFLETTLVTLALLPHFIAFFTDVEEDSGSPGKLAATFLGFVLNLAFALSVLGFLIMHASLVAGNSTTIEAYEKKVSAKWKYDLGRKRNFEQVFGARKSYWLIPSYAEEDMRRLPALHGLDFPCKPDVGGDEL